VPSRAPEGWGVVVNEALNSSVPVLASHHVNAAADLVRDGRNGTIVPASAADDASAWAAAIAASCTPDDLPARQHEARRVGRAFAPDHAARWLLALLDDAAAGPVESRSFVEGAWRRLDTADDRATW
jgi:glycosyltransferase involved in cell wall biosynthesis